jgi:hypothetical protein
MLVSPSIQPKALHETKYNVVAYPFATDYQNSNQWVLEVLAAAMAQAEGAPAIVKREQAQQWLRQQKYQPSVLHIGLGKRVGARLFVANATTTDHPAGERISGNYSVVTVESVFDFLHQRSQLQQELVIPMCRWPVRRRHPANLRSPPGDQEVPCSVACAFPPLPCCSACWCPPSMPAPRRS